MKPLTLVLPCYNEADSLPALVRKTLRSAERRGLTPEQFSLIVVDNGSTDDTAQVLREIAREPGSELWRWVRVPINRGYGHGVMRGLTAARQGVVSWSHADEQCDPEDVFRAWEDLRDPGPRVLVKGARTGRTFTQLIFSRCFDLIAFFLLGKRLHEINAQPKVFDSELITELASPPDGFTFDLYVVLKAIENGYQVQEIPVRFPPRKHGESRWAATFRSKVRTIRGFLSFMIRYRLHV